MDLIILCIVLNIVFFSGAVCIFFIDWEIQMNSRSIRCINVVHQALTQVITFLIPENVKGVGRSVYRHLFYTRTCFFQMGYLFLVVSFHMSVINDGLRIVQLVEPESYHLPIPLCIAAVNLALFVICCYSDPGVINQDNVKKFVSMYPYDGQIYMPGTRCSSCLIEKPARSKHCGVYNRCIFRFDHYCIWIRNSVGGQNHRYFLLLLLSLALMCISGAAHVLKVLCAFVQVFRLWDTKFYDSDGISQEMTYSVLIQTLLLRYPRLVFIGISCVVIAVIVIFFVCYHSYLVFCNETTNERYKRYYIAKSGKRLICNIYDRGIKQNIVEELCPLGNNDLKKEL